MVKMERVVIVDVMHLAYKAAFGGMPMLTATIEVDGKLETINTQLMTFIIKCIHRWSRGGRNPVVVCCDSVGGNRSRKAYFSQQQESTKEGYKGGRHSENSEFYTSINTTLFKLHQSGVCVAKIDGYEADDLIKEAVLLSKAKYPELPIDVITGDADLLPLVDEQVSVFLKSLKYTWAENKDIEKRGYYQVTPSNYQGYVEGLTAFKSLTVPYNTVLLAKLLRGDKSDGIMGYPKFTPTKYRNLVEAMQRDGVDLGNLFRYDANVMKTVYRGTEEVIPDGVDVPTEQKALKFYEPPKLTEICSVLSNYLEEDIVNHVRYVYNGINLNAAFVDVPDECKRRPAKLTLDVKGYNPVELQTNINRFRINLPMNV